MNVNAIYSDGTHLFRIPPEPEANETVEIRLRVEKGEQVSPVVVSDDKRIDMSLANSDDQFDFYSAKVSLGEELFKYHFELCFAGSVTIYDRVGIADYVRPEYEFQIMPGFSTPEWAKGAVMYQILVDRFFNGDSSNDVLTGEYYYIQQQVDRVTDWDKVPAEFGVCEFYGGDLEGVRQKLGYLRSLGVQVIYFNPLFVSPSNHKYDAEDYDYIDPHYGKIVSDGGELLKEGDKDNSHATRFKKRVTDKANLDASNEFFAQVVQEAHNLGMKVILDGVFNHCGSFNKWLDRENIYDESFGYPDGAYKSKESPYNSYFKFADNNGWPSNGSYEGWWGYDTLPKLNYEDSPELYEYILGVAKKWVSEPYNADGWRLDVAADLGHSEEFNHRFWRDFRNAVKQANPEAIVLAEHYGDSSAWLDGTQWDTIMNYDAFMEPLTWFLTGMEKHSDEFDKNRLEDGEAFKNSMLHYMTYMKTPSLYCSMNQLSNHDHSRFLTRTNHVAGRIADKGAKAASEGIDKRVMKQAVMVQMAWPGAPTLYYGDEVGQVGFTDPDNRRTYPWGHEDIELLDYHRDMIGIHNHSEALRKGSFKFLDCGKGYISFARFCDLEQMVVVVNASDEEKEMNLSIWEAGIPKEGVIKQLMTTTQVGYSILPVYHEIHDGKINITLQPHTAVLFVHE